MGFVIWYRLEIPGAGPGGLPLRVSNDILSGDYVLDANIKVPMLDGPASDRFEIKLTNLPADVADGLKARQARASQGDPLTVEVRLGYFDDLPAAQPPQPVLVGGVTAVENSVDDKGDLLTILRGRELAAWQLLRHRNVSLSKQGPATPVDFLEQLLRLDQRTTVEWQGTLGPAEPRTDWVLRAPDGLRALDELARWSRTPFTVGDKVVRFGLPPGPPVVFDPEANLVALDSALAEERPPQNLRNPANQAEPSASRGRFEVRVLGDPALRVGQAVGLAIANPPPVPLRIGAVTHEFSSSTGYTCRAVLLAQLPGQPEPAPAGAHGVAVRIRELAERSSDQRASVTVGQVAGYQPGSQGGHLATLGVGQSPGQDVVAPSVQAAIDGDTRLHDRSVAAPFAWHRCGLVVPVYEGQRALLAHSRGDANDAVVVGFLWSQAPDAADERPRNEPGDWWLCLPTELAGGRPTGKGVNDLTDAAGLRVVQAKGLRITVGADGLPPVGERPEVPDADVLTIEHHSGTTITVDADGAVEVKARDQPIRLTNGSVTLALDGSTVEVS
jgi:hypothetical protein